MTAAALSANRRADISLSFPSSAREDVVEGAAEQTADGVELVIADCVSAERSLSTSKSGCSSRDCGPPAKAMSVRNGRGVRVFDCTAPWFADRFGERFGCGRSTAMPPH